VGLPNLTQEDLKEIGVGPVGHRRILLDAIVALRDLGSVQTPPVAAVRQRALQPYGSYWIAALAKRRNRLPLTLKLFRTTRTLRAYVLKFYPTLRESSLIWK
jgi:hypothetical protein